MHLRIILAVVKKDLKDSVRDGRVLFGLLTPLALGLLYNVVMPDQPRQTVTVAIAASGQTALPQALRSVTQGAVELRITDVRTSDEVTRLVSKGSAAAGLVIPPGFDADVAAGRTPTLTVVRPSGTQSPGASYVETVLDPVLRQMAGQRPPALTATEAAGSSTGGFASLAATLGTRKFLVMGTLVLLVAMIAIYLVPVLVTEEAEKKTLNALMMVGSQADVVAAKAVVGVVYTAVSVPLLLVVTGLRPADPALFAAGVIALAVSLIGFGLLFGALVRNMNQLNTWSSVPLMVLIMPTFLVVLELPTWAQWLMAASPSNQAMRLLADGLSGKELMGGWALAFAVIGAWAVAGYGLLLRTLSRRET